MKRMIGMLMVLGAMTSSSYASHDLDGCYQLYLPDTLFPVFCLQGTIEEGIGGAGVRLGVFKTNTSMLAGCSRSTKFGVEESGSYFYEVNDKKEMILSNVVEERGRLEGEATFGKTTLKFIQIKDEEIVGKLLNILEEANITGQCG